MSQYQVISTTMAGSLGGEAPNSILGKRMIPALGPEDGGWAERPGADVK